VAAEAPSVTSLMAKSPGSLLALVKLKVAQVMGVALAMPM